MPRAPLLALAGLSALATWCVQWPAQADPTDLPAPFAPATQTISPLATSMLTAEIATSP